MLANAGELHAEGTADPGAREAQEPNRSKEEANARLRRLARGAGMAALLASSASVLKGCPPGAFGAAPIDKYPDVLPPRLPENLYKLVSRATFGVNAREAELALNLGYDGYLEYQLDHASIEDEDLQPILNGIRTLTLSVPQLVQQFDNENEASLLNFVRATFLRSAYSQRQLYERMVEFWTNHFNIHIESDLQEILKQVDDREVIRPNALGNFKALLTASAQSPAMLVYLNNAESTPDMPNQNYARELLELHTLGPQGFTQQDVLEVARCFTGWTIETDDDSRDFGGFKFDPELHDFGSKVVLGREIPSGGGIEDGLAVIDILTSDPVIGRECGRFLGRKLAVQFHGYDPPEGLVNDIANAYVNSNGDIKAMVRAALSETWIAQSTPKVKRPYHLVMSMLRGRPSNIRNAEEFSYLQRMMGNHPYLWPPPNGYPDSAEYWGTQVLQRWNSAVFTVLADEITTLQFGPLFALTEASEVVEHIDLYWFNGRMADDHRAAVATFLGDDIYPLRILEAITVALGSPDYQWY